MNAVFDSMGTLFELTPVQERLGEAATEAWYERTLHSAATLTIVGEFVPLAELAAATLATTCAMLGLEVDQDDVLEQLRSLPPADDARVALEQCDHAYVLTNGGREAGEQLLQRAGLDGLVERVFGVDEVRAYKPDPRPYRHVLEAVGGATLVATHAWDCRGAVAAGMDAVWVDRSERAWPFPGGPVRTAGSLAAATRP